MPVTTPPPDTVAIPVYKLPHMPLRVGSLNDIVDPTQTEDGPAMAAGAGLTDNVRVTVQPEEPSE